MKVLYEIFYIDVAKKRFIPYSFYEALLSYLNKIPLPVQVGSKLAPIEDKEHHDLMVFSHGLGAGMHTYSAMLCHWASQGKIVISINH